MTDLVGYLLLFTGLAIFFLFIHLVMGRLVRPVKPDPDKLTIYECGEPTIGSAWIQFDLRYYVIALLFVIFDVEVAFFFPWAVVFGKANAVASADAPEKDWAAYNRKVRELIPGHMITAGERIRAKVEANRKLKRPAEEGLTTSEQQFYNKYRKEVEPFTQDVPFQSPGRDPPSVAVSQLAWFAEFDIAVFFSQREAVKNNQEKARKLAWFAVFDIAVFFGVLLVGFAYLWRRGDINWVRSTAAEKEGPSPL